METNDSQTQEKIVIDAFKVAIEAVRKVGRTAKFRCIYEGDGGQRLNKETGEMEPSPDIACAKDVPGDIAGLRKYFEPNFEAMLIDQTGDDILGGRIFRWFSSNIFFIFLFGFNIVFEDKPSAVLTSYCTSQNSVQ